MVNKEEGCVENSFKIETIDFTKNGNWAESCLITAFLMLVKKKDPS